MRSFKKLFAIGIVSAMAMIMSVSVFAEDVVATADGSVENPYTDAYVDGAVRVSVIKDALPVMTEGAQYTVVVVPADEEITDSNIYYINQADGSDSIWATTTSWGTPVTLGDGTYVVRVGNEAGTVDETYFTIGEQEQPPAGPVVTFMNGTATFATVDTVDGKATLPATNPTLEATTGYAAGAYAFTEWVTADGKSFTADTVVDVDTTVYPKFKAQIYKSTGNLDLRRGDANTDGSVNATDRGLVQRYYKTGTGGKIKTPISPLLDSTKYTVGDANADGNVNATDRGLVQRYYKTNSGGAGELYYVINK